MSSSEKIILQYLESKNIEVEVQKTFDDCKLKRKLPFDFYLPRYNTCIEADGQFHYIDNIFDGDDRNGYNTLENVQYRDSIKTKYCKEHDIKLVRIPYWEYDNIEKIINEIIN